MKHTSIRQLGVLAAWVASAPMVLCAQGIITTVAGGGKNTADGGLATSAQLQVPTSVSVDSLGNFYIAEPYRVRKVDTLGIITTVAGNANGTGKSGEGGPATAAKIAPTAIAVDKSGNVYITDGYYQRICKVDAAGILTTFVGPPNLNPTIKAALDHPSGLVFDKDENLFFVDYSDVRRIDKAGVISIVAGTRSISETGDGGPAVKAAIGLPWDIAVDDTGKLYILTDTRLRKVDQAGTITTIAGVGALGFSGDGGPASSAALNAPTGVAVDHAGNIYIADHYNWRIRKVDTAGTITTVAGNGSRTFSGDGGPATGAGFNLPFDVAVDPVGDLYIADTNAYRIRKVTFPGVPRISANGVVNGASFQPGIVPGSWATILGSSLASKSNTWDNLIVNGRLPIALDDVSVTVDGKPAYLYYVSSGQINFVVPDVGAGPVQVVVTNSAGVSDSYTATSAQFGPAFFAWPRNQPVATRQDFTLAAKNGTFAGATTVAAKPGEVIILWGTGFGPTNSAAPVGFVTPSDATYSTGALPAVMVNNIAATVYGAALAPGFAGLYQIAIQVPDSLADGDYAIQASIGGVPSPSGTILSVQR
jgi:uncharacterized protein (TIGR03437 family)